VEKGTRERMYRTQTKKTEAYFSDFWLQSHILAGERLPLMLEIEEYLFMYSMRKLESHRSLCQNFSSFTVHVRDHHTNVQGERGLHILQFWKYAPYCMLISQPLVVCTLLVRPSSSHC
jgi:hypothetical protein